MSIEKKEKFVRMPVFLGDGLSIKEFIVKHLKYPPEAIKNRIEATVHVRYSIDSNGNVNDAKHVGTAGYGLDEEAVRVVSMMKFSKVKNRNLRLTFNRKIDIHFRLPKPDEALAPVKQINQVQVGYTYTSSPGTQAENKEEKPASYTYNIIIK